MNRKTAVMLLFISSFLGIAGCSTVSDDAQEVKASLADVTPAEDRIKMLGELNVQKDVYLRLMSGADSVEKLNRYKNELDRIMADINRLEIEVPQKVTPPPKVKVEVSEEQYEIIKAKKERLAQLKLQRQYFDGLIAKAKDKEEADEIRGHIENLQGDVQNLEKEIRVMELEDVGQQRFEVKHMVVYGPLGIACKTLEILLKRLFILFEY